MAQDTHVSVDSTKQIRLVHLALSQPNMCPDVAASIASLLLNLADDLDGVSKP